MTALPDCTFLCNFLVSVSRAPYEQRMSQPPEHVVLTEHKTSSVRFLVCGDVGGHFHLLSKNLDNVQSKQGPFSFAMCIGNFFGNDFIHHTLLHAQTHDDYLSGRKHFVIPVYFIDSSLSYLGSYLRRVYSCSTYQFSSTLHFLGGFGFTRIKGLQLGFMSGLYAAEHFFSQLDDEEDVFVDINNASTVDETPAVLPCDSHKTISEDCDKTQQHTSPSQHRTSPSQDFTSPSQHRISPSKQHASPSQRHISSSQSHTNSSHQYDSSSQQHDSSSQQHVNSSPHNMASSKHQHTTVGIEGCQQNNVLSAEENSSSDTRESLNDTTSSNNESNSHPSVNSSPCIKQCLTKNDACNDVATTPPKNKYFTGMYSEYYCQSLLQKFKEDGVALSGQIDVFVSCTWPNNVEEHLTSEERANLQHLLRLGVDTLMETTSSDRTVTFTSVDT